MSVPTQAGARLVQSISKLLVLLSEGERSERLDLARFLTPGQKVISGPSLSKLHSCLCLVSVMVQEPQRIFYRPCLLWGRIICRRRRKRHKESPYSCSNLGFQGKAHEGFSTRFHCLVRAVRLDPVRSVWSLSPVFRMTVQCPVPIHHMSRFPHSSRPFAWVRII